MLIVPHKRLISSKPRDISIIVSNTTQAHIGGANKTVISSRFAPGFRYHTPAEIPLQVAPLSRDAVIVTIIVTLAMACPSVPLSWLLQLVRDDLEASSS